VVSAGRGRRKIHTATKSAMMPSVSPVQPVALGR
jgi:hypothetical protein